MEVRLGREGGVCGCVVGSGPPNLKGGVANFFFSLLLSIRRWIWGVPFFGPKISRGPAHPAPIVLAAVLAGQSWACTLYR